MNSEPDDPNLQNEESPADAENQQAAELERIHQQILNGQRPKCDSATDADSGSGDDLNAAVRLLGMIENVRRRGKSSVIRRRAATGTSALEETPVFSSERSLNAQTEDGDGLSIADDAGADGERLAGSGPIHRIGRFEILRELGKGGCGIVFLAHDAQLNRHIALKVPRPDSMASSDGARRFLREAKAAALLTHPNIVTVYEAGRQGPILYMACEWIDGPTLSQWTEAHPNAADSRGAARIVATLADAIQHAHIRNVIHRDLKPGNILLDLSRALTSGDATTLEQLAPLARVSDFGMARLLSEDGRITKSGDLVGTPSYLAPELINSSSDQAGPATDIYGLGIILYELLTGRLPFEAPTLAATLRAVELEDPVPPRRLRPEIAKDLDAICLKCLEKLPERRYASAFELSQDLNAWLECRTVQARHPTTIERVSKWVSRNRVLSMSAAVVFLGMLVATTQWFRADRALAAQKQERERTKQALTRAQQERDLAERHLKRTESTIDAMLNDVEEVLEASAQNEEFHQRLLTRALQISRELMADQSGDPRLPLRTATALKRVAEINFNIGHRSEALKQLEEVIRIVDAAPLEESDRDEATAISNGARIGIATIFQEQERYSEIEQMMSAALKRLGPQPPNEEMEASVRRAGMTRALAKAQISLHRNREARTSLLAAQAAVKHFPLEKDFLPVIKVLSNIQNSLGANCADEPDKWRTASQHFQESIHLNEIFLQSEPDNATVRSNVIQSQCNLASHAFSHGSPVEAEALYKKSAAEARKLMADAPMIRRFHGNLLTSLNGLISTSHHFQRTDEALGYVAEALAHADNMQKTFGDSAAMLWGRSTVQSNHGIVLKTLVKDQEAANSAFRDALTTAKRLVELYPEAHSHHGLVSDKADACADHLWNIMERRDEAYEILCLARDEGIVALAGQPNSTSQRRSLAMKYERLVSFTVRMDRHDDAIAAVTSLVELYPYKIATLIDASRLMARCSTIVAENAAAAQGSSAPESTGQANSAEVIADRYEQLALDHLRVAISLGYTDIVQLSGNTQFASIHDHAEFMKLTSVESMQEQIRQHQTESASDLQTRCKLLFHIGNAMADRVRDPKNAEKTRKESIAVAKRLVELFPDVAEHHLLLSQKAGELGDKYWREKRNAESCDILELAIDEGRICIQIEPDSESFRLSLATQYERFIAAAVRAKRHEETIAAVTAMVELLPQNIGLRETAARLMARCSFLTAANAKGEVLAPEQDTPERDAAIRAITDRYESLSIEHLRRGIELGYRNAAKLSSDDRFKSVHDHPEFLRLIAAPN